MKTMLTLANGIDAINERVGKAAIWLVLIVVIISAGNAVMRYTIDWSSNGFLEIQWYLFSAIFLLCSGYVLLKNEHIRIDVFGIVFFLLPMVLLVLYLSWPVFMNAWTTNEGSPNPGGLVRWPVRLLMPIGFLLLTLQAISELIKRIAFLTGNGPNPLAKTTGPTAEQELAEAIKQHQVAPEVADFVEMNRSMVEDRKPHEGSGK
jgi:TRAP-type mannitol/chloroaromatic compound transport system permease small subunit